MSATLELVQPKSSFRNVFFKSRPRRPRFTPHLFFVFFLSFFFASFLSSLVLLYLGSGTAGTLQPPSGGRDIFVVVNLCSSRLCLLYDIAATPLSLSSCLLIPALLFLLSPSPHTCTLPIVSSLQHLPSLSCCPSVSIHPCIFPILSRVVVLLYMGLTLSSTCVSRHLYGFVMLRYEMPLLSCMLCAFRIFFLQRRVRRETERQSKIQQWRHVVHI